mmetsp:Transcript_22622/g.52212  ORF Transcript_22622/g.52212 Transcript_22622/m.52212 type:complete len:264 (+) Transcript_22622:744-1535(+)
MLRFLRSSRSRGGCLLFLLLLLFGLLLFLFSAAAAAAACLAFLSRCHDFLLTERYLSNNGSKLGLIHTRLEPTNNISKGLQISLVANQLERIEESRCNHNIRQGHLISHKISPSKEIVVKNLETLGQINLGLFVSIFVERHVPSSRIEPNTCRKFKFVGGKVHPSIHGGLFLKRGTNETGVTTKTSQKTSNGMTGKEWLSTGKDQHGCLARGARSWIKVRHLDINTIVFGRNQGCKGTEGTLGSLERIRRHGQEKLHHNRQTE